MRGKRGRGEAGEKRGEGGEERGEMGEEMEEGWVEKRRGEEREIESRKRRQVQHGMFALILPS